MRKFKPQRALKNKPEAQCVNELKAKGFQCTKRGWPDFFAWNERGEFAVVEVKPSKNCKLKAEQEAIMQVLSGFGVICYRFSPDKGFERVGNVY